MIPKIFKNFYKNSIKYEKIQSSQFLQNVFFLFSLFFRRLLNLKRKN